MKKYRHNLIILVIGVLFLAIPSIALLCYLNPMNDPIDALTYSIEVIFKLLPFTIVGILLLIFNGIDYIKNKKD